MDLDSIYGNHPLSARTILARLRRQRVDQGGLTEWDLAIDEDSSITDQNHSGGVQAVLELGNAARVNRESRVVDVGAGLGGSARVLALAFGCHVVGVDSDFRRVSDAVSLTALVGLATLVTFKHLDALTSGPNEPFDVLWGQESWIHFSSPAKFLDLWLPGLARGGHVIVVDSYLARPARSDNERFLLSDLQHFWGAHLHSLPTWQNALVKRGCIVTHVSDRSDRAVSSLGKLLSAAEQWPPGDLLDFERDGWRCGQKCFSLGLISAKILMAQKI